MDSEKKDFDKEAAGWDGYPARVKLSEDIARAITGQVRLEPDMDALDFGCGTGLLTLRLQPFVRSITGADSSQGMLDMLQAKIGELGLGNVTSMLVDLGRGDRLAGAYDLIVSNMTLHHIRETEPLLAQFHEVLSPGGYLCISDLDPDGGRFHGDNTGVFHFGFDRAVLRNAFISAGFDEVRDITAAEMTRPVAGGGMGVFSIFLMSGRRR
jgi:2-polyprenyl-3-methyl-5-hydroxy-6-metoxy-1,4-benzoquinol methylase